MAVVKCENGHFYDNEKYSACPHCANQLDLADGDEHTVSLSDNLIEQAIAIHLKTGEKQSYTDVDYDDEKTISIFSVNKGNDFVTGWLVCVDGPEKGRDYRLHYGFNKIGRSRSLDIYLEEDRQISRDAHCAVVYEYNKNEFFVMPQDGNLVYLNDAMLTEPQRLSTGDIISLGATKLEFIAFCRGMRKWEK